MKHPVILLALLASLAPARAQVAVPLPPPPGRGELFEAAIEPAAARDRSFFFAQVRPEESRDRSTQRPSPDPRPPGSVYSVNARGFVTQRASPIIVRSQPLDQKERAAAEEDLGIMARLLEKEIEREAGASGMPNAMGIAITRLEGRNPSVMLLEDYGAVFAFNVNLSLTPSPARATEKKADQPTDSPWERTRRELFGAGGGGGQPGGPAGAGGSGVRVSYGGGFGGMSGGPGFVGGMSSDPNNARLEHLPYDAKRVEALKRSLLEATKHAANIRALKPGDYLTVVVQGSGSGGAGMSEFMIETRSTSTTSGSQPRVETVVNRGGDSARSGTLTLRVKKSDAEEFAKGKLTAEQFEQKALITLR